MYGISKKEVYIPVVQEIYDYASIRSKHEIKTRFNKNVITISLKDVAETLDVSLENG